MATVIAIVLISWPFGFVGALIYYRSREAGIADFLRCLIWPLSIPIDFICCDRKWPQRGFKWIAIAFDEHGDRRRLRERVKTTTDYDFHNQPEVMGRWR